LGCFVFSGVVDMMRIEMVSFGVERAPGKDLSDPAMTMKPNPMANETAEDSRRRMIEARNEDRLWEDARKRSCPWNGAVYAGIMDTRYKGE